ncbi:uncharacterized protein LOC130745059 [Lotus japonicus]|uniref:uncharacterized protein LOC130745059 n=1 Tax=Lotus japonicus TaxID=34305 RepID=UPI002585F48B|nr:uncharacterized protein LOC130745059 [Lotus japonicus]
MLDQKKLSTPLADVRAIWSESGLVGSVFRDGLACQVGQGAGVLFWIDHWTGPGPFRLIFPRVFAPASHKRATVLECGTTAGHKWVWNISFVRDFLGWEREQHNDFQAVLQQLVPKQGVNVDSDCIVWKHDNMGFFTVKSLCAVVEARWFTEEGWMVPNLLRPILPSKIALFMWQVQKNRMATKENLARRGVALEEGVACVFCSSQAESVTHLFLHCPKVWILWVAVLYREGVWWTIPGSFQVCLAEWGSLRQSTSRILWDLIPYAICWVVWRARNDVIFNDKVYIAEEAWESHLFMLFSWIKAWWKECPYGADQFARGFTKIDVIEKVSARLAVPWKPPQGLTLKFNVDGSFQAGCGGVGGILRNSAGIVVGKFSRKVEVQRADEAEVLAILYALLFCQQHLIVSVEVESDSTLAVGWVKGEKNRPWKLTNELNMIDYLMPLVVCNGVNHILREGNAEADELAKQGCFCEEPVWLFFEV